MTSRRSSTVRTFVAALVVATSSAATAHAFPAPASGASISTKTVAPNDTATSTFEIGGLRVILRRNTASDVVAANLFLVGGTQQLTPETQGIETLLLAASERGTRSYPGARARTETARLGSSIVVAPSADWTMFGVRALRSTFDATWAIFADRLMHPTLDPAEVNYIRTQMLTGLRQVDLNPDALLERLADSISFAGHPYGLATTGTELSLRNLTVELLREYHRSHLVTSRMLLVVVGNIERPRLEQLVRATIGTLPRGEYKWTPPPAAAAQARAAVIRPVELPTNYILGYYAGPPATEADYAALRVASAILSGRFFAEIRSRLSLSYSADAPFIERALATGGVYVTTVNPNATLQVMRTEIDRLQREPIDPRGLERLVGQFITDYFLKNETNADQASFLARAEIYRGDYRQADRFVEELRRVRPEDIRRVARDYMRNFRFAYVGDPRRLDRTLFDRF